MNSLSVCAETVFGQLPFEQRVREIVKEGFAIEFWHRPEGDIAFLEAHPEIEVHTFVGCNEGSIFHPDGVETYLRGVERELSLAKRLHCRRLILITGEIGARGEAVHLVADHPATRWLTAYKVLGRVAELAEKHDVVYSLEHLNTKVDHPHYPLPHVEDAARLVEQVGSPRIRLLLDLYHAQVEEGNLVDTIRQYAHIVGHVHVADVPGRHEPGTGEINYPFVARALRDTGYEGTIGMEAFPLDDRQALRRFREIFGVGLTAKSST